MSRMRIGQVLEKMGKLSEHDIEEILHEQSTAHTPKTFGQIALTWGLCEPEHIWKAWAGQLDANLESIDLHRAGIDTQAASMLPRELANHFCAIGVRAVEDELVIAISDPGCAPVFESFAESIGRKLRFVRAEASQIREMIARYYPPSAAA